ncbi:hypothetical protein [Leucobacter manosquensis]|uniref:PH domain-containing protein n=1 Tax=Leucobacter manosquensis TaxID=2810611 RepID=A0ABS5M701_9MICO|nr:hypothetical protein [Leucobacter manosquensis]MBS3182999.1 hypothetical protein [Leucobacter manosquensis]
MNRRHPRGASRVLLFPSIGTDAQVIAGGGATGAKQFFAAISFVMIGLYFAACLLGDPKSWQFTVAPYFIANSAIVLVLLWATHRVAARPQRIRYFTRAAGLWIGYSQRLKQSIGAVLLLNGLGLSIANAAYALNFFIVDGGSVGDFPRLAWVALTLIPVSLYGLAQLARYVRLPPGILLDERGLTFAGPGALRNPRWDEIRDVQVKNTSKVHLVILEQTGYRSIISAQAMGSDPVTVAAILRFYLQRPQHRIALVEPQEALRCFLTHHQDR